MLTDMTVRQAKATGKTYTIADFDGLSHFVSAKGSKAWHFRYSWMGQRSRISLGSYLELSLREARKLRDETRSLVAKGTNPRYNRLCHHANAVAFTSVNTFQTHAGRYSDLFANIAQSIRACFAARATAALLKPLRSRTALTHWLFRSSLFIR